MFDEFRYILSKIEVKEHVEWGVSIELIDYDHKDYIEDVLCEKFGLEYEFSSNKDITGGYVLYFCKSATFDQVKNAVAKINNYHELQSREFKVAPYK